MLGSGIVVYWPSGLVNLTKERNWKFVATSRSPKAYKFGESDVLRVVSHVSGKEGAVAVQIFDKVTKELGILIR